MSGPCCSCLSITYTAAPTGDGFVRDCWSCDSCGCEFVRRPPQADIQQAAGESAGVDIFEDPSKAVCEHGHLRRVCSECEATATLAARDAEIERLKTAALCDACAGDGRADCMCGGTGLASDAVCHLRDQLFTERALREKRERQLVWAVQVRANVYDLPTGVKIEPTDVVSEKIEFADLLAAIDEATKEAK